MTIDLTDPATYALWRELFVVMISKWDPDAADAIAKYAAALIQERERAVRKPETKVEPATVPRGDSDRCDRCGWPFECGCAPYQPGPALTPPAPEAKAADLAAEALADFDKAMTTEVIPELVRVRKERLWPTAPSKAQAEPQPEKATCGTCGGSGRIYDTYCPTCSKPAEAPAHDDGRWLFDGPDCTAVFSKHAKKHQVVRCPKCEKWHMLVNGQTMAACDCGHHRKCGAFIDVVAEAMAPVPEKPASEKPVYLGSFAKYADLPDEPDWTTGPDGKPDSSAEFERMAKLVGELLAGNHYGWRRRSFQQDAIELLSHLAHVEGLAPRQAAPPTAHPPAIWRVTGPCDPATNQWRLMRGDDDFVAYMSRENAVEIAAAMNAIAPSGKGEP
jgi:hypothetical protein